MVPICHISENWVAVFWNQNLPLSIPRPKSPPTFCWFYYFWASWVLSLSFPPSYQPLVLASSWPSFLQSTASPNSPPPQWPLHSAGHYIFLALKYDGSYPCSDPSAFVRAWLGPCLPRPAPSILSLPRHTVTSQTLSCPRPPPPAHAHAHCFSCPHTHFSTLLGHYWVPPLSPSCLCSLSLHSCSDVAVVPPRGDLLGP